MSLRLVSAVLVRWSSSRHSPLDSPQLNTQVFFSNHAVQLVRSSPSGTKTAGREAALPALCAPAPWTTSYPRSCWDVNSLPVVEVTPRKEKAAPHSESLNILTMKTASRQQEKGRWKPRGSKRAQGGRAFFGCVCESPRRSLGQNGHWLGDSGTQRFSVVTYRKLLLKFLRSGHLPLLPGLVLEY